MPSRPTLNLSLLGNLVLNFGRTGDAQLLACFFRPHEIGRHMPTKAKNEADVMFVALNAPPATPVVVLK